MHRRKCNSCGKDAFAYRIEADGSRTYLCERHLPDKEESHPQGQVQGKEQKPPPP
jgi:hypothetical protein